jgi:hydrogenase maturation protease
VSGPLVIGLGSGRGDDAAGLLVARRLKRAGARFEVLEHRGELLELIELWCGRPTTLVDAAVSGAPAGTIHRLDVRATGRAPFALSVAPGAQAAKAESKGPSNSGLSEVSRHLSRPELRPVSGHAFGLAQVIELARALGRLPPSLVIYAIEGRQFAPGSLPSARVRRAVRVVERMLLLTNSFICARSHPATGFANRGRD